MTPEEQRIAIAEACGFEVRLVATSGAGKLSDVNSYQVYKDGVVLLNNLPDYLNDLNAMHEAEKILTDEQFDNYEENLYLVAKGVERETYSAPATQRAEAFLKTIGKWAGS